MRRPARDFLRQATAVLAMAAAAVLASIDAVVAQISVDATVLSSGYSQNFDSLGTSSTASLPTGWKMTAAGAGTTAGWATGGSFTAVNQQASSGTSATGGRWNWGSSTTDRAPGFMTSGGYASPNGLLFGLTNLTTSTITGLTLAFDYERYRINTTAASVTFFSSTDGSTWTAVTAGDSGAFATGTNTYTFTGGTVVNKSGISISGLTINQDQSYYLKWNFNTGSSNSQGIGLDNFQATFTASGGGGGANYYWVGADTTLGGAGTWAQTGGAAWRTTDTDGTGEAWDSTKIATFGGASSGTVTVTDHVTSNAGLTFATTGYTLTGGTVSLGGTDAAANTITTASGTATTITSVLAGSNGLTKAGPGTLVFDGVNTYTGGTIVSAGTLVGTTASLQGNITNNGELRFDQAGPGTYSGLINGSGSLTKAGPGIVTLSGTNTFTGPVTISGGVLSVGSQANLGGGSAVNIDGGTVSITGTYSSMTGAAQAFTVGASGGTVEVAAGVTASKLGSQLLGPGNTLTKTGAGTLALTTSGTSTIGTLNVNAGSFRITSNRIGSVGAINVGSGGTFWIDDTTAITTLGMATGASLSFSGDGQDGSGAYRHSLDEAGSAVTTITQAVSLPGTARFTMVNRGAETVTDTFSGVINGAGGLIKDGTGTMILSGTNTYTGGTTVSAGTLSVAADAALGGSAGGITLGGGRLEMTSGFTLGAGRTITAATGTSSTIAVTSGTVSFGGPFTGSGNLDKAGAGTLSLGNASSGYSGAFTISAGTLEVTAANAFANATLTQTGGTLLLAPAGGGDVVIPEMGGSGGEVSVDSRASAVFRGNSDRAYDGRIRGQGAFKKEGNGILTLNADNDFAGDTRISQGRLKLGAGGGLSATPRIDIDSGAIFDTADKTGFALGTGQRLGGKGTVLGSLEFGSGSQFAFDPTGPLLVGSGTVSFAAGFGIGSIFGLDSTVAEGTYTLLNETTGGSISFANLANVGPGSPFDLGGGKTAYFQQGSLQVVVVPEPETFFIGGLGLALAGLATCRHRRRRRSCPAA